MAQHNSSDVAEDKPQSVQIASKAQKNQKVMQVPCLNGTSTGEGTVQGWQRKREVWRLRQWIHQAIHAENRMALRWQCQMISFHCRSWHKSLLQPWHSCSHRVCVSVHVCVLQCRMCGRRAALHFRLLIEAHQKDAWSSGAKPRLFSLNPFYKMQLKPLFLHSSLTKLQSVCGMFSFFSTMYFALCKLKSGLV